MGFPELAVDREPGLRFKAHFSSRLAAPNRGFRVGTTPLGSPIPSDRSQRKYLSDESDCLAKLEPRFWNEFGSEDEGQSCPPDMADRGRPKNKQTC
jgi:hypothetical protein